MTCSLSVGCSFSVDVFRSLHVTCLSVNRCTCSRCLFATERSGSQREEAAGETIEAGAQSTGFGLITPVAKVHKYLRLSLL